MADTQLEINKRPKDDTSSKIEETKRSVEKGMRYLKDQGVDISAFMFGLMEKIDLIEGKEDDAKLEVLLVHMRKSIVC